MPKPTTEASATLEVERLPVRFVRDESRVITRPFFPGGESRIRAVMHRVKHLPEVEVERLLAEVFQNFEGRHKDIRSIFDEHYEAAAARVEYAGTPSEARRLRRAVPRRVVLAVSARPRLRARHRRRVGRP